MSSKNRALNVPKYRAILKRAIQVTYNALNLR